MRVEKLTLNGRSGEENLLKLEQWANKTAETINYNLENGEHVTKDEMIEYVKSIRDELLNVIVSKTGGSV